MQLIFTLPVPAEIYLSGACKELRIIVDANHAQDVPHLLRELADHVERELQTRFPIESPR